VSSAGADGAAAEEAAPGTGQDGRGPDAAVSGAPDVPEGVSPEEAAAFAAVTGSGNGSGDSPARVTGFQVSLPEFEGPFDLLLGLIAKHKLDVTTLALSKVTDEFIAYIRSEGPDWDLDQASEFLLIAATLLDLKAARLLPTAEVEDEEDLALLEARDLLFARLLQYRAYKQVAAELAGRHAEASRMFPRAVKLEPSFADLLPEVVINLTPEQFAALAVKAMTPKEPPKVSVTHLHGSNVSVREQVAVLVTKLRQLRKASFKVLCADAPDTLTIVARFLGLLELFREAAVLFDQEDAFGDLQVSWTGSEEGEVRGGDQFDEGDGDDGDGEADAEGDGGDDDGHGDDAPAGEADDVGGGDGGDGRHGDGEDLDEAGEAE
jgi:segregation and condensation protein A